MYYKNYHLIPDCPFKDQINLKFFTKCRVGNRSLEDCPIILEKIMNKKNVNHLSRVPMHEVLNTKKLQDITRQGTKIGEDKDKSISTIEKGIIILILQIKNKYLMM